jgi:hypothetical protein
MTPIPTKMKKIENNLDLSSVGEGDPYPVIFLSCDASILMLFAQAHRQC